MRIVAGSLRGRTLATPSAGDQTIRPTGDRVRQSLFNMLEAGWPARLDGARVLDLFSGTGALGFEAMSRGAASVLFVDNSAASRALVRKNIEAFSLQGCARLFRRDATRLGPVGTIAPFDLVFADPPYGRGLGEKALQSALDGGWLARGALVVIEEAANAPFAMPSPFTLAKTRETGDTVIRILELENSHD